jgi:8-oxo-dGTP pyrophosphatase MutT (NUDIX family)
MIDISNNTITTANALLYKVEDDRTVFLLVQENDSNWGLPGGAKDVEDKNLQFTIQRELKEELGLEQSDYVLRETEVKREFEYNHFQSSRFGKHGVVCFYLVQLKDTVELRVSDELINIVWLEKETAIPKLRFDYIKDGFREASGLI